MTETLHTHSMPLHEAHNSDLTISLAQVSVLKGDVSANLINHLEMITQSSSFGANVVVFPELSLTGYELELAASLAFDQNPLSFTELSQAARKHDIVVIAGCPLRNDHSEKPTIGAVICFPNGAVDFYSKQYLHSGEEKYCSAGREDYQFSIKGRRVSLAICADFSMPEHSLNASKLGADLYLASALISESGYDADAKILSKIATSHQFPVLLSNHISRTGGWLACGNNTVWDANGQVVFRSESQQSCLVLCSFKGDEITVIKP
jgi:predicted amidohydrolase